MIDQKRLDVFTQRTPDSLVFEIAQEVVEGSLLDVLLVDSPHVCQPFEKRSHRLLEHLGGRPHAPDARVFEELQRLQE